MVAPFVRRRRLRTISVLVFFCAGCFDAAFCVLVELGFRVGAVVHVPFGAHPTALYRCYDYDAEHLRLYAGMNRTQAGFEEYVEKYQAGGTHYEDPYVWRKLALAGRASLGADVNAKLAACTATPSDPTCQALRNAITSAGLTAEGIISVVDEAQQPRVPVEPQPIRSTIIGALIGLLAGLAAAFALEFLTYTIRSQEDLETKLEIPPLGVIPKGERGAGLAAAVGLAMTGCTPDFATDSEAPAI